MTESFYAKELCQMVDDYRSHPLKDIRLHRPHWLDYSDPMSEMFTLKPKLLKKGQITYACIVQANTILFRHFPPWNCPAQIVYSTDPYVAEHPNFLREAAMKIYSYKGKSTAKVPKEWQELAKTITNEYSRACPTFAIEADGRSIECRMIPTIIHRKLLPKRKLYGCLLPILTIPKYKQILILPKKYWTKDFTDAWLAGCAIHTR